MKNLMSATALVAILVATPALAQDASPASPPAVTDQTPADLNGKTAPDATTTPAAGTNTAAVPTTTERFVTAMAPDDWLASKLIGTTVYGVNDESLGDINDVISTADGSVKAFVIGVGGFLGIGEKAVAVAPASITPVKVDNGVKLVMNTTKDELKAAPEFKPPTPPVDQTGSIATDPGTPAPAPRVPAQ